VCQNNYRLTYEAWENRRTWHSMKWYYKNRWFITEIYQCAFSSSLSAFTTAFCTHRSQRTASTVSIHCDGNCSIQWQEDFAASELDVDCCHDNCSSSNIGSLQPAQFSTDSPHYLHALSKHCLAQLEPPKISPLPTPTCSDFGKWGAYTDIKSGH